MSYEFLQKVPLFADLPRKDLEALCEMVEEVRLDHGEILFEEGDQGDRAYVVRDGELEIIKASSGREVLLAVRTTGEVIGEVALLEDSPRMAGARARGEVMLIAIGKEQLNALVKNSGSAARTMFYTVISRLRSTTGMLQQSEKMAQLGTLTAGVAHELNNPAAAVRRGADQLQETLEKLLAAQSALAAAGLDSELRDRVDAVVAGLRERAGKPVELDAMTRSDLEEEMEEWLEDQDVEDAWELAPMLVGIGLGQDDIETLDAGDHFSLVLRFLGEAYGTHRLLAEVGGGARRVSDIVRALKSYSYLDQAPVLEVDLHEGLDDTLLILRNKLKEGIQVVREYADELPHIQGYGSELNQVWTNLLDNAADALGGEGKIVIRTRRSGDLVEIEIEDDGPGIPEEIRERIFDAFFTTKPPGKGTGLGLDISYGIIVNKHRGSIRVYSEPGSTCFKVQLPIDFNRTDTASPAMNRPDDDVLRKILDETKVLAVVGISANEERPAHSVPKFLQKRKGYTIVPVNPGQEEVLGEKAYPSLAGVDVDVDTVLVFRRSDAVPEIMDQAIEKGVKTVWMQEGIVNEHAAEKGTRAGLNVVMDTCMRSTWLRFDREEAK